MLKKLTTQEIRLAQLRIACEGNFTAAAIIVLAETIERVGNQTHNHQVELTVCDGLDITISSTQGKTLQVQTRSAY